MADEGGLLGKISAMAQDAAWSQEEMVRINSQQNTLAAGVDAGTLWMEPGVAERAAAECDAMTMDLNDWLAGSRVLTKRPMYGDNADGNAMAGAVVATAAAFIRRIEGFRDVSERMAETYRKAGGLVESTEQANAASFKSETP